MISRQVTVSDFARGCWPASTKESNRSSLFVRLKFPASSAHLLRQFDSRMKGCRSSTECEPKVPYRTCPMYTSPRKLFFDSGTLVSNRSSIAFLALDLDTSTYGSPGSASMRTQAMPAPSCPRFRCFSSITYIRSTPILSVPYFFW